jgi:hypothetical protein
MRIRAASAKRQPPDIQDGNCWYHGYTALSGPRNARLRRHVAGAELVPTKLSWLAKGRLKKAVGKCLSQCFRMLI